MAFFQEILGGKIGAELVGNLQNIVLFGVFFLLYKMLFSDMVGVIGVSLWHWLMSLRKRGEAAAKSDAHGGHDDHG